MNNIGNMYGPDFTFLGIPRCDLDKSETYKGADVVIVGAPIDSGTSHRSGAKMEPQAIRMGDYLPHDASRPHLAMFLNLRINPGFWTVVIAHVMFCISFVVVTVKARIASLDPKLEQAAMDLYANERETFRYVTLPLVMPGIAGAALLAFSLSFDDFIITNFNSGVVSTFPKFVYVSAARGIPAQANVIGSAMFFIALIIVIVGQVVSRQRKKV